MMLKAIFYLRFDYSFCFMFGLTCFGFGAAPLLVEALGNMVGNKIVVSSVYRKILKGRLGRSVT